jgi:transcriptional regulator with XRE-family HTH domain
MLDSMTHTTNPMTPSERTRDIGRRVAAYRKMLGFRSSRDLADAIPSRRITASVLQNIESGRKADVAVSQLVEIADALGISFSALLEGPTRPEARPGSPREATIDEATSRLAAWLQASGSASADRYADFAAGWAAGVAYKGAPVRVRPTPLDKGAESGVPYITREQTEIQKTTIGSAVRHRSEWTTAELELLADTSLTAREIAPRIGRTYYAVLNTRSVLRRHERERQRTTHIGDEG